MAGKGELYKRKDGKWAWRLRAANGQGYGAKRSARGVLEKLMRGEYDGPIEEVDG